MNTEEINRKYEYKILHTVDSNFEEKIKEAETDGWEVIGQILLNRGGAYNNDTYVRVPMRKAINKPAEEALKQTPKVGDWVETKNGSIYKILSFYEDDNFECFGLRHLGDWRLNGKILNELIKRILTESEVIDFLTKEAEKRYNYGDNVNCFLVGEINLPFSEVTCIIGKYFIYKGVGVLDLQTGEWSEVVEKKEEDYDFEYIGIGQYRLNLTGKTLEVGKYKLVKI